MSWINLVTGVADFDRQVLESALDWWRDAGVDALVEDAPRDWFAAPAPAPARSAHPPAEEQVPAHALPDEWDAFLIWRGGEHAPEAAWAGPGVLASGPAQAAVMVLADVPDRQDCTEGKLLTGEAGQLFDRMLAAIGLDRDRVHLASICAKRPVTGRVSRDDQARLGEIARHHVGLVAPRRLLLLGDTTSRALLGTEVVRARGRLHAVNHKSGTVEAVTSFHPRLLLDRPAMKREAWADLQMLIRGLEE